LQRAVNNGSTDSIVKVYDSEGIEGDDT